MTKRILLLLLTMAVTGLTATAQKFERRGLALGADRDTLLYIIASPFDNWYINLGGGLQTFMGNEVVREAQFNKLNYNVRVEVGKWIIPDVAISLRLSAFDVDGKSSYGLQPFINKLEDTPTTIWNTSVNDWYYNFHAYALSAMGFVVFDWTNFLSGYEKGKLTHMHVYMPLGLGMSMLFGSQRNPHTRGDYAIGDFRRNFELSYSGGLGIEYIFAEYSTINLTAELFGSESTWDWSPYDNTRTIFDLMPMVSVGVKFNFLNSVTKYIPQEDEIRHVKTYHEFQTVGSQHELDMRKIDIEHLRHEQDSLVDLIVQNNGNREVLIRKYDSLASMVDSINRKLKESTKPENVLAELLDFNEEHGLPAVVVYFELDRFAIDYNASKRLQSFAREVNRLDDSLTFYLLGAADSATGTESHNQWLSENRCNAVFNTLVKENGVDAKRLIVKPLGGITDYEPQENNRMGMLILRTEETEEIVNRWLNTGSSGIKGGLTETIGISNPSPINIQKGHIMVEAAKGEQIMVLDADGQVVLSARSRGKDVFAVDPGTYTVKLGDDQSYTVTVK